MQDPFDVTCPCCQGVLTIDPERKTVLSHRAPVSKAATFDLAGEVAKLKQSDAQREKQFSDALAGHRRKQETLSRRFDDLFQKAKENEDAAPPVRDIDL
jgi:Zn-finger nucleic acid-binding protein